MLLKEKQEIIPFTSDNSKKNECIKSSIVVKKSPIFFYIEILRLKNNLFILKINLIPILIAILNI